MDEPFSVAALDVTKLAAEVITVGALGVVNERSDPNAVPSTLDAIAQKK